jgi:hypothetical protein
LIFGTKWLLKFANILVCYLNWNKKRRGGFYKTVQAKIKENRVCTKYFGFHKSMQGYRWIIMVRCHNDAKTKRTSNFLIGVFSGLLQSTPLTWDLAPGSTIRRGEELGKLSGLHEPCCPHDTTNKKFFLTPPTRVARSLWWWWTSQERTY